MAGLLDAEQNSMEQIIEEEQAHGVQVAALTNAAPGDGEGGSPRKGVEETQCSVG